MLAGPNPAGHNPRLLTGPRPTGRPLPEADPLEIAWILRVASQRPQPGASRPPQVAVAICVWPQQAILLLSELACWDRHPPWLRWVAAADTAPAPRARGTSVVSRVPRSSSGHRSVPQKPSGSVSRLVFCSHGSSVQRRPLDAPFPKRPTPLQPRRQNRRRLRRRHTLAGRRLVFIGERGQKPLGARYRIVEGWDWGDSYWMLLINDQHHRLRRG